MTDSQERTIGDYAVRPARRDDTEGARSVMLDTFYHVLGHGYVSRWHADVIDLDATYFDHPRQAMFIAVHGDEIVGTAAVRADGPKSPPHPEWISERYPSGRTAQLCRVYVRSEHRRNGLARTLVDLACRFAADTDGYESIYLHTDAAIDGAEPFWRGMAKEIYDGRTDPRYSPAVHFEIPILSGV